MLKENNMKKQTLQELIGDISKQRITTGKVITGILERIIEDENDGQFNAEFYKEEDIECINDNLKILERETTQKILQWIIKMTEEKERIQWNSELVSHSYLDGYSKAVEDILSPIKSVLNK